ncbi:MAG TPA: hypothetical protein VEJ86_00295 [Candidatus Binataceae bacterium]|nr:hypothetical protein [Candidatus Binataceae bacterium]
MASNRIEIELPAELRDQLQQVADALGIPTVSEAAVLAVAEWVAKRRSELDDRDPDQRYFINEALDELTQRKEPK